MIQEPLLRVASSECMDVGPNKKATCGAYQEYWGYARNWNTSCYANLYQGKHILYVLPTSSLRNVRIKNWFNG